MFDLFVGSTMSMGQNFSKKYIETRLAAAVPWTDKTSFQPRLTIQAASYKPRSLFCVNPTLHTVAGSITDTMERVTSPDERWLYCEMFLKRGKTLRIYSGKRRGDVMFDGDVIMPALFYKRHDKTDRWSDTPFMSMTPMELISLRNGTRFAKGHVVIAGLGLGHQLIEVAKRKSVKKITIVEQSEGLIEFVLPAIMQHVMPGRDIELVIGDAYKEVPRLTADVALIDIFECYGFNEFRPRCPNIPHVWCWGGPATGE